MFFYYEKQNNQWKFSGDCFLLPEIKRFLIQEYSQEVLEGETSKEVYKLEVFQQEALKASPHFQKGMAKSIARELFEGQLKSVQKMKTLVLTSEENFVWQSMQEIIPSLEELWALSSSRENHEVYYFNVEKQLIKDKLALFLQADNIFATCFNLKMAKTLYLLREKLSLPARTIIQLHNMATIGCWPFYEWKMAESFTRQDLFISTCSYDLEALKLTFPEGQGKLIPFTAPEAQEKKAAQRDGKIRFAYVGRISAQKNIHSLLAALSLLKDLDFVFELYGGEDKLGSPNMGIPPQNYLDYLKELVETLDLKQKVIFKGHIEREELYREISDPELILLSASLHSDENFGMALFRGLLLGQRVVCSNWGGHFDFFKNFPEQVELISVYETKKGPQLSPFDFLRGIKKILEKKPQKAHTPLYYQINSQAKEVFSLATSFKKDLSPLRRSQLAQSLHEGREGNDCKIFSSYSDKLAQPFFVAYGMKNKQTFKKNLFFPPWAKRIDTKVFISNPHKGNEEYAINPFGKKELSLASGEKIRLDDFEWERAWQNGDLYSEDE